MGESLCVSGAERDGRTGTGERAEERGGYMVTRTPTDCQCVITFTPQIVFIIRREIHLSLDFIHHERGERSCAYDLSSRDPGGFSFRPLLAPHAA